MLGIVYICNYSNDIIVVAKGIFGENMPRVNLENLLIAYDDYDTVVPNFANLHLALLRAILEMLIEIRAAMPGPPPK